MTTPLFDADAYLTAIQPPTLKVGGRVFVGRHLSLEEWAMFNQDLERTPLNVKGDDIQNFLAFRRFLGRLTDAIFPRPWWKPWVPKASAALLRQPVTVQVQALTSFLRSQAAIFQADAAGDLPEATGTAPM